MENTTSKPGLLNLLEVNQDVLPKKTLSATAYLERRWDEKGKPRDAQFLIQFLDEALKFCPTVGFYYPKIVLKRLKQLQRGEWIPEPRRTGEST